MESSFRVALFLCGFQGSHLTQATQMARGLTELGGQKYLNQVPGHLGSYGAPAHAQDIHVIILDTLFCREVIVDQAGTDALDLVGANRRAHTAAADRDAASHPAR